MKPELKTDFEPSEDIFDENDIEALPAIREGLRDLREGRSKPADEVFDRLEKKYRAML